MILKWFGLLMSAYVHCFSHWLRSSTKWRKFILFIMGSVVYFELFMVRTNKSHSSRENLGLIHFFFFSDIHLVQTLRSPCLLSYLYERGGLFIFFLSRDCLLVIIICFCGGRCLTSDVLWHLTCCLIPEMSCFVFDIELINNDNIESFQLTPYGLKL